MPHKQKKNNALKNGAPKIEKKEIVPETPATLPATNYKEIHENEANALRSIYSTDFEDVEVRRAAWHQASEVAFKLHLRASSNPDVRVDLLVSLPATYPKTVPNLTVQGLDDLRRGAQSRIKDVVKTKPKTLLGSEMIYEIALSIQDILEDVALSQAEDKYIPSLEEERIVQEAAAIQQAEAQKQEELKKQEQATAEEEKALQILLESKIKQRQRAKEHYSRRRSKVTLDDAGYLESSEDASATISFDPPLVMNDSDERPITFRSVFGKTLIGSAPHKETFTVRPVTSGDGSRVPLLILRELSVREKESALRDLRQEIRASEDKLEILSRLRHPNLVDFIGFKIYRPLDPEPSQENTYHIYTLFEYANKGSLSELLDIVGSVAADMARAWMIQLLDALEYYHRNGLVHGNIHCGRVLLFRNQSSSTVVKLLSGVEESLPVPSGAKRTLTSSQSPFWIPPELTQEVSHPTTKTDVWDLGIVFLQMSFGKDVMQRYTSANALMNAIDLSMPLEELLGEIFKPDPKKRPTAFQIQPFEFFRIDAPLVELSAPSSSMPLQRRARLDSQGVLPTFSRYGQDFDEVGRLGKGGFGQVVKARNKLDGGFYAVKKISSKSGIALKDTLSEIMLLSRLNHPYVVRYFTAWLEQDYNDFEEDAVSSTEADPHNPEGDVEFGYSTSGLDFISSKGYPEIEFGYDSDERADTDAASEEYGHQKQHSPSKTNSGLRLQRHRSSSSSQHVTTTLYIQMEYCEKHTLRDLIRNGLYDDIDSSWRLFRQILDGLSHIHSHGIIHRDLKPDNIFIDVANNPRIGDFGLATTGQFTTAVRTSNATDIGGNYTRSIGTTYYVAPEMKSASVGQYNEKVDMYSLGIIFLEMCHPLKTAMERDFTLQKVREKIHTLPATFEIPEKAIQGEIIQSLLSHRPSERPTAAELLQSGKIPLQVEEEMFRKAIMGILSDPNSPDYKKILSAIFSQPPKKFEDIAWDMDSRGTPPATEVLLQSLIKERLISIFRKHGAVEMTRNSLFPRSEHYPPGVVRLLDPAGNLVQLPYDLTLPNARSISRLDSSIEKTFTFGTVYRESIHGGAPRGHLEVDFDMVSHNTLDLALKEAEVMKVLDEILNGFPSLRSAPMCFHINHSDLLDAIMSFCRISPQQKPLVKEVISKLNIGPYSMQKIRSELRSPTVGVASTSIDDLSRFDFRDTPDKALKRLRTIMEGTEYADRLAPIFARLNAVVSYLKGFRVRRKVYVNPLSSLNDKFFRGSVLFQCVSDTKRRDVFAAGGRYDSLIQEFHPKVLYSGNQRHAVGFNLGWEKLCLSMSNYLKGSNKAFLKQGEDVSSIWRSRRCDVLVASFDATVLRTVGVGVVQELWAHEISAELAVDASSLEEILARYRHDNHTWVVIVKQDSMERGLKVKNISTKEEYEVRSSELAGWLRSDIVARNQREHLTGPGKPLRHLSHQDSSSSDRERDPDVRILTALHRSKKTNRRNIIESAIRESRSLMERALDGPIAAIDTRDDVLEALRDTRLSDPDGWRTVIQNGPLTERKYMAQVHELLSDLANERRDPQDGKENYRNAFIYNYRTGNCIYYDLSRGNEK
ncbi:PEK/GCN2 protein kinase [Helicocarpus griseus UAMH5409]|uniref:non-specific serine/threonine protein kinase n=1 Tax=Helicocarpus griseus UAMH5409 TaxID=1447875 RepID=A0A2B7XZQ6_9EURO|nr:PEK/GCN2 protein kinase [Helicocarpus griseus UAMH5409]